MYLSIYNTILKIFIIMNSNKIYKGMARSQHRRMRLYQGDRRHRALIKRGYMYVLKKNTYIHFFLTLLQQRKYFFKLNFQNGNFDGFTLFETLIPRITFLAVCLSVYYQYNSKTNHSKNFKFHILHLYFMQMLQEIFLENLKLQVQGHTKDF